MYPHVDIETNVYDSLFLERDCPRNLWLFCAIFCFLVNLFSCLAFREHGVVGDMRDAWPNARVRKNASLIRTFHGFKGTVHYIVTSNAAAH